MSARLCRLGLGPAECLRDHIRRVIAAAGPLTPEQGDRLRSLLPAPAAIPGTGDAA